MDKLKPQTNFFIIFEKLFLANKTIEILLTINRKSKIVNPRFIVCYFQKS